MPIKSPMAPKFDPQVVAPFLNRIKSSNLTGPPGRIVGTAPDDLIYSDPFRNYFVGLNSILDGHLLDRAEPRSWTYLLVANAIGVGELEVATSVNDQGEEAVSRFLAIHHGTSAQNTLNALHVAESLPEVNKTDFEIRFLLVPALYFAALWLHASSDDVLIPTNDGVGALQKGKSYSTKHVLEVLRPLTTRSAQFNTSQEFR